MLIYSSSTPLSQFDATPQNNSSSFGSFSSIPLETNLNFTCQKSNLFDAFLVCPKTKFTAVFCSHSRSLPKSTSNALLMHVANV